MAQNETPNVSTFAQDAPEPTELERINQRIAAFKIGFTVTSAQVVNALVQSHLSSGKVTQGELIPLDAVSQEYQIGLTEYQTMVENAQRRSQELIAADQLAKQQQFVLDRQAEEAKLQVERQARKAANLKVAQLEAVLASHGINMDLNGDGVIGVRQGDLNADGFVQLTTAEVATLAEQHGITVPTTPIPQTPLAPRTGGKPSGSFALARAMNPETEENTVEEPFVPHDVPQAHTKVESSIVPVAPIPAGVDSAPYEHRMPVPVLETIQPAEEAFTDIPVTQGMIDGTEEFNLDSHTLAIEEYDTPPQVAGGLITGDDTESFMDEVARVEEVADADATLPLSDKEEFDSQVEEARQSFKEWDASVSGDETNFEISDEVQPLGTRSEMPEFSVQEEDTTTQPNFSKPVISGGNSPALRETLASGDTTSAPVKVIPTYDSEEELIAASQAKIDAQTDMEEEESFDEITIPSSAELDAMSKKNIMKAASELNFTLNSSQTKAEMIESFQTQTDELIESLQDDGSFVSAVDSDEVKTDGDDSVRDGGYF